MCIAYVGLKCDSCDTEGQVLTAQGCVDPDELQIDPPESCDDKECGDGRCTIDENFKAVCTCEYDCPAKTVRVLKSG